MFHVTLQGCIPVVCIFPNVYSSFYIVIAYTHIQGASRPTDHPSAPLCLFYPICKGIKGWFCANSLQLTVRVDNSGKKNVKLVRPVQSLRFFPPQQFQVQAFSTYEQVLVTDSNTKKMLAFLKEPYFSRIRKTKHLSCQSSIYFTSFV